LSDEAELETSGFWDALEKKHGWVIVEWPEKLVIQHLPADWPTYHLTITVLSNENVTTRLFELQRL
jgi:hypothetical protein